MLFWLISNSKPQFIQIQPDTRCTMNLSYSSETRTVSQFQHLGGEGSICLLSQGAPELLPPSSIQHREALRWKICAPHHRQTPQQCVVPFILRAATAPEQVGMRALLFQQGRHEVYLQLTEGILSHTTKESKIPAEAKEMLWQVTDT